MLGLVDKITQSVLGLVDKTAQCTQYCAVLSYQVVCTIIVQYSTFYDTMRIF